MNDTTNSPAAQPQEVELLSCPFCGGAGKLIHAGIHWSVHCANLARGCFAYAPSFKDLTEGTTTILTEGCELPKDWVEHAKEKAIAAWNTRVDLPRATAVDGAAIRQALRPIRGCATDDQYVDVWERVTALLATPRATEETTVGAALAELQEMFGDCRPEVSFEANANTASWKVKVHGKPGDRWYGETLADCMAQVRAAAQTGERVNDG